VKHYVMTGGASDGGSHEQTAFTHAPDEQTERINRERERHDAEGEREQEKAG